MAATKEKLRLIAGHIRRDPVLIASFVLALLSMLIVPPSARYADYIDTHTLALLLSLMLVVAGLKGAGVFDLAVRRLLSHVHDSRALAALAVGICFFASMLITNDVALISFVPLTVMLLTQTGQQRLLIPVIVLQTVAANLGSSLTPLGNPQNLYIFETSGMSAESFVGVMDIPVAAAFVMLCAALMLIKPEPASPRASGKSVPVNGQRALLWGAMFVLCVLAVLRVVSVFTVLAAALAAAALLDRKTLAGPDYDLLLTFVFLFIFVGNLKNMPALSEAAARIVKGHEMLVGTALSQVISNVPATMLLAGFTENYRQLLLGVNLGGLGTLIASMASLISYKAYAGTPGARTGRYIIVFTAVNVLFLLVLLPLCLVL